MARRRVNKKLIVQLCVVGGVLALALVLAYWYQFIYSKNPTPHIQAGDAAMQAGEYEKAVKEYAEAIRLKDTDPMIWVKLGDAHSYMAADDQQSLLKARQVWESIVTTNPKFLAGQQRLLQLYQDFSDASAGANRARHLENLNTTAQAILRISPQDNQARYLVQEVIIDAWLSGQPTPPEKVDEAITELRKLQTEQPENSDIPFAISRALASKGLEAMRSGDRELAKQLYDEAGKVMDDALVARPDDPKLLYRKAQLILAIGPRVETIVDRNEPKIRELSKQLSQEVAVLCERAISAMKPEDDDYLSVARTAALMYQRSEQADLSEKTLRNAMEKRPDDISVRLQLAELLRADPKRLDEAVKLVSEAPANPKIVPGIRGMQLREAQYGVAAMLADMKLDQYMNATTKDAAAQALLKEAEDALTKLISREPNSPRVLRIQGKLQLFQGKAVEAVQTLNKALGQASDGDRTYFEIKYLLGRAYQLTGQNGEAEKFMREIADRLDYMPAQLELCRILLSKRDAAGALKVLTALEAKAPKSPEVISLRMAYNEEVNRTRDPKVFREQLATLPEATLAEKNRKASIAMAGEMYAEAVRLAEQVYKERPDERAVIFLLASAYDKNEQTKEGIAALKEFINRHPDSPGLRTKLAELEGKTKQELEELRIEDIKSIKDPILRNLSLYEYFRRRENSAEMDAAYEELVKIAPEDKRVIDIRFSTALAKRDWKTADALIETITANDYDNSKGFLAKARRALAEAGAEVDPERRKTLFQAAIDRATELVQTRGEFAEAWIALATAQQAAGRLENAVESYSQALNRQFNNQSALEGLIRTTYMLKRKDDCRRHIDTARRMFPKAQLFIEYEVSWEAQFGDAKKIIPIREKNLADNPESPVAYGNLAAAWQTASVREMDPAKAKEMKLKSFEIFKNGVDKFPNDPNLVAAFGEVALSVDKFNEGLAAWQKLAALDEWKDKPEMATRISSYYRRGGKIAEGISYLQEFIKRKDVPELHVSLAELLFQDKKTVEGMAELEAAGTYEPAVRRRTELLMMSGDMAKAKAVVESALAAQPENPALQCRLAFIQLASQDNDGARATLAKVLAANPRDPEALFYMALIEHNVENLDKSLSYLAQVLDLVPDFADGLKLRSDINKRRNNFEAAANDLEAVLRKVPDDKSTRIQLIEMYISQRPPQLVDAERLAREALSNPVLARDYDVMHALARVFYAKGEYKQALQIASEGIKIAPDNVPFQETYFRTLTALGDFKAVVSAATTLLEKVKAPSIYATRAGAYAKLKQPDKALADFEAGFDLALKNNDGLGQQSIVRAMQSDMDINQAIAFLKPRVGDDINRKILLAQLQATGGQMAEAIKAAEELYAQRNTLPPTQLSAYLKFLGGLHCQPGGDVKRAKAVYDEYLKMVPFDFEVLNNIAYLLLRPGSGGTPQEALEYTTKAYNEMVRLNEVNALIADTHGQALMENGRLQEAITTLRDAATRQEFPEVFINLADAYRRNGEFQEATSSLDRAQQLIERAEQAKQPVDPESKEKISTLRTKISSGDQK